MSKPVPAITMSPVMMGLGVTGQNAMDNVSRLELGKGFSLICYLKGDETAVAVSSVAEFRCHYFLHYDIICLYII